MMQYFYLSFWNFTPPYCVCTSGSPSYNTAGSLGLIVGFENAELMFLLPTNFSVQMSKHIMLSNLVVFINNSLHFDIYMASPLRMLCLYISGMF